MPSFVKKLLDNPLAKPKLVLDLSKKLDLKAFKSGEATILPGKKILETGKVFLPEEDITKVAMSYLQADMDAAANKISTGTVPLEALPKSVQNLVETTTNPPKLSEILSQIQKSGYHLKDVDVACNVSPLEVPYTSLTIQFDMHGDKGETVLAEIGKWVGGVKKKV